MSNTPSWLALLFLIISNTSFAKEGIESCKPDETWVIAHDRVAYIKLDGTRVSASWVRGHCRKRKRSENLVRFSNQKPKNWPLHETFSSWKIDEQERLLSLLDHIPNFLLKTTPVFFRSKRSITPQNPASSDRMNQIAMYDMAFDSDRSLRKVLVHELAHLTYKQLSSAAQDDFNLSADWIVLDPRNEEGPIQVLNRRTLPSKDSLHSPEEDFANLIEQALENPRIFSKDHPKIERWLRKTFKTKIEYRGNK